jgi:hypothetical protein
MLSAIRPADQCVAIRHVDVTVVAPLSNARSPAPAALRVAVPKQRIRDTRGSSNHVRADLIAATSLPRRFQERRYFLLHHLTDKVAGDNRATSIESGSCEFIPRGVAFTTRS